MHLEEGEEETQEEEGGGVESTAVEALHLAAVAATTVARMGTGPATARLGTGETSATGAAGMATSSGAAATVPALSESLLNLLL